MKKNLIVLPVILLFITKYVMGQSVHWEKLTEEDQCIICHSEMEILPENFSKADIHMQLGLSCAGCHGGDPGSNDMDISMSLAKGFVGVPDRKDIPKFCGRCHSKIEIMRVYQPRIATDQESQYYTSVHGKMFKKGDQNVAECVSCHTAHSILSSRDPRSTVYALNVPGTCNYCHGDKELVAQYGLSGNEMTDYSKSVHGKALLEDKDTGAPACNDCHGNHGATPPGLASVSHVCGTCHINNAEYFNATNMAKAFEEMDYHGCEGCHGNHLIEKTNDEMLGIGDKSLCVDCHSEGDDGYEFAVNIKSGLDNLTAHYDSSQVEYNEVIQKGMNEVEIGFLLQEIKQDLIQSRTLIHTFDTSKVNLKINDGINKAVSAINLADYEINEYYTRRNGFAIATIIFTILIGALYFKLRDKGKSQ